MKSLLLLLCSFLFISCSQKTKVPVVKTVPEASKEIPEAAAVPEAPVEKDIPAEEPAANPSEGLPDVTGTSILDVNCALAQDKRLISIIERTDAQGWGVVYHKFGTKKTIAIARNDKSFCDEVVGRVKNTLQSAGFECDGEVSSSAAPIAGDETSEADEVEPAPVTAPVPAATTEEAAPAKSLLDKAKDAAAEAKSAAGEAVDTATSTEEAAPTKSLLEKAKDAAGKAAEAVKGE